MTVLPVYGMVRDVSANDLKDAIDQLVDIGLIERATDGLPILSLTANGRKFIKDHSSVTLIKRENSQATFVKPGPTLNYDETLFEKLRQLRKEIAEELKLPAFTVFHDSALRQMASEMPVSLSEFARIRGVGSTKLQRFGDRFVAAIVAYKTEGGKLSDPTAHSTG